MKIYVDYRKRIFDSAPWKLDIYLCKEDWRSAHSLPHIHGDDFLADIRGNEIKELEIPDNFISLYGWHGNWLGLGRTEHIQIKNLAEGDCIEFVGCSRRYMFEPWDRDLPISVNINKEFDKRNLSSKYSKNQILGWNSTWTSPLGSWKSYSVFLGSWKSYLVFGLLFLASFKIFELMST